MRAIKQWAAWRFFYAAQALAAAAERLDVDCEVFTEYGTPKSWTWRDRT